MTKVRKVFRTGKTIGDVGVEVEVEGNNLPRLETGQWRTEGDGSLRGEANEYVFRAPVSLPETKDALSELSLAFKENGSEVFDTGRAGVHVHINCQELSMKEVYNFFTLYLIFEDILVDWCGDSRVGNLFCLRTQDAEYLLTTLKNALKDGEYLRRFSSDDLRYASMNVKALSEYGSLEFRAMRSTDDMTLIYQWASVLLNLREKAKEVGDPTDLIYQVSAGGEEAFVDTFLGDFAEKAKENPHWEGYVVDGMRRAQEIAFGIDWRKMGVPAREVGGLVVEDDFDDDFPPEDV